MDKLTYIVTLRLNPEEYREFMRTIRAHGELYYARAVTPEEGVMAAMVTLADHNAKYAAHQKRTQKESGQPDC